MTNFSNRKAQETFGKWKKSHPKITKYVKKVLRLHKLFPKATLKELSSLRIGKFDISHKPWNFLTGYETDLRIKALFVISDIRKGRNLAKSLMDNGITLEDALINAGKVLYQKANQWFARKSDRIQRARWFYSEGKRVHVIIDRSEYGSLISKYLREVREAIRTGDKSLLTPFKRKKIRDVYGRVYSFETDLDTIYKLEDMIEHEGDRPIYDR